MKGVEAQIAGLRASPRARRALEARVWHHLSKRSKRYTRRGRGRGRGKTLDDGSVGSNDSAGSAASNGNGGPAEGPGQGKGVGGHSDDVGPAEEFVSTGTGTKNGAQRGDASPASHGQAGSRERPAAGKAVESASASVSERVAAQALHAQEVLRRKRCVSFALDQIRKYAADVVVPVLYSNGNQALLVYAVLPLPLLRSAPLVPKLPSFTSIPDSIS